MKKLLPLLLTVTVFAACNTSDKKDLDVNKDLMMMDTSRIYPNNVAADTGMATTPVVANPTPAPVAVSTPRASAPRRQTATPKYNNPVTKAPAPVVTPAPTTTAPAPTASTGTTTGTTTEPAATVPAKKKGWSEAAKDATIGGVGGAVIGGVIGKGAKGAVIGGVIGAAGGYILGRKKDKASGRIDTTKKN